MPEPSADNKPADNKPNQKQDLKSLTIPSGHPDRPFLEFRDVGKNKQIFRIESDGKIVLDPDYVDNMDAAARAFWDLVNKYRVSMQAPVAGTSTTGIKQNSTSVPSQNIQAHDYLSTACLHDKHQACRRECKFCPSVCKCECHLRIEPA